MLFKKKYDIIVVGAGLYGSTFARVSAEEGKKVLLVEKNSYVSGHTFTKTIEGIPVHVFGPHYFHTNSYDIWNWVTRFANFNSYQAKVKAMHKGSLYSLPFNMMTFYQLWGCVTPGEAQQEIQKQRVKIENPKNLEEFALSQVGRDIYNILIYGYTKKQWGREPRRLPASIIRRIPIRYTYNDNYHHTARYTGVPVKGYTQLVENIIDHPHIELQLNTDFFDIPKWQRLAKTLVYSGPIDQLFNYQYGALEYRSLEFKHVIAEDDQQGTGQINYTEDSVPYTRITEHRHFYPEQTFGKKSVISLEYPTQWQEGKERFYPVSTQSNLDNYGKYAELAKKTDNLIIGGRLGTYKYLDMDMVIGMAIKDAKKD